MKPTKLLSLPLPAATLQLFISGTSLAGTTPKAPVVPPPDSDPWAHVLLQLDFSDHYITPRGLNVDSLLPYSQRPHLTLSPLFHLQLKHHPSVRPQ